MSATGREPPIERWAARGQQLSIKVAAEITVSGHSGSTKLFALHVAQWRYVSSGRDAGDIRFARPRDLKEADCCRGILQIGPEGGFG